MIEDIKDAINWVRTKAIEWYDFDVSNIAVMGSSAGGYLSLLIGTIDIRPKVIDSLYTACQHVGDREVTNGQWERFNYYLYCRQHGVWLKEVTGINNEHDYTKLIQYNPINNITVDFPPTLLLHGDQDTDVPYEQSVLMHKKLKEKGVATKLITIKGADHVFDQNFSDLQVQSAFENVIDFLRTHLVNEVSYEASIKRHCI
ncbi:prolyl oligopeptidase family serine peptidase [Paenibacillus sp. MER 180]|uniref:alpha/beta hydrolase family protein n=1 Tax=Paenibacillus sp. MER 180 TaxID=2939570 RepID=UPI00288BF81D|nr:prolyl oligopeptidase family serine peptidase [Paenibacillus sp. MER 180]